MRLHGILADWRVQTERKDNHLPPQAARKRAVPIACMERCQLSLRSRQPAKQSADMAVRDPLRPLIIGHPLFEIVSHARRHCCGLQGRASPEIHCHCRIGGPLSRSGWGDGEFDPPDENDTVTAAQTMNLLSSLTACLAIVTLLGCTTATGAGPLTLRSLGKGGFSGIKEARKEVVKDKVAWEKLWTEHAKTTRNAAPAPEVDFATDMVIVATMGTKRTGGYSVEIVNADIAGKKLVVSVKETSPKPGAMAIQALTAPFHFVTVPKKDLEVEFVEATPAGKK
jgi:hypothetical protein